MQNGEFRISRHYHNEIRLTAPKQQLILQFFLFYFSDQFSGKSDYSQLTA
jgi:hypothetical protein